MIRVSVEVRTHAVVRRMRITAECIERVLELCGENARIVLPIEANYYFAPENAAESVEEQPTGASVRRTQLAA